jgi:hypothetical protein
MHGGTFVELGALDGVLFSNTKFYEDTLGWTGVLIEAQPSNAAACKVRSAAGSPHRHTRGRLQPHARLRVITCCCLSIDEQLNDESKRINLPLASPHADPL